MRNVPSFQSFLDAGKRSLNMAFDHLIQMIYAFDRQVKSGALEDSELEEFENEFWQQAQPNLENSLITLIQGIELILKGFICETSAFLILEDRREWSENADFLELKTIAANELIKVINSIHSHPKFDEQFKQKFETLRKQRNKLIHTGLSTSPIEYESLLTSILYFHSHLFPKESWSKNREEFIETSWMHVDDYGNQYLGHLKDTNRIIEILPPSEVKRWWGVDKKSKLILLCVECILNVEDGWDYAQTESIESMYRKCDAPETKKTRVYKCVACEFELKTMRFPCEVCKSGRRAASLKNAPNFEGRCLSCGNRF